MGSLEVLLGKGSKLEGAFEPLEGQAVSSELSKKSLSCQEPNFLQTHKGTAVPRVVLHACEEGQRLLRDKHVTINLIFPPQANSEPVLDPQQIQAFDQLCRLYRGSSRVMFV